MVRMWVAALLTAFGVGSALAADKPEIRIEDILKLFTAKVSEADAIKCSKLEDALELAAIFAKDGVDALANHKMEGCDLLLDIGTQNRKPAQLASASVKVHQKTAKAPVYELTGKTEFVEEDDDVTVYVVLLKPVK